VGLINLPGKKTGAQYIIIATDYLMRLAEAQLVKYYNADTTVHFIFEYILSRFGCQKILMSDRGTYFLNKIIESLT